jgi:hypothetical protein
MIWLCCRFNLPDLCRKLQSRFRCSSAFGSDSDLRPESGSSSEFGEVDNAALSILLIFDIQHFSGTASISKRPDCLKNGHFYDFPLADCSKILPMPPNRGCQGVSGAMILC